MGFNGEVLVERGETFIAALNEFWNWEEEVCDDWPLRDGWHAVGVRTPTYGDELAELGEAAAGPVPACLVVESDVGHIRGISAAGHWEAWLNPDRAAPLRAWDAANDELEGGLSPDGNPAGHARVNSLKAGFEAESEADRPTAARACTVWAGQSCLSVETSMIEDILAMSWEPQVLRGLFALLEALGIAHPESEN